MRKESCFQGFFFFLFRRFSSVLYRWGRNCPFSFFSVFCLFICGNDLQKSKKSQIRENKETKPESNRNNLAEDFFWIKQKKDLWKGWERKNEAGGNWSGILWRWRRGTVARQKDHTNASNRQRNGVFFFLYGLFSYCRLNQEVLLRWLMEAVMEVVVVCSSDRRPTVYGMRPGYYKQGLMDGWSRTRTYNHRESLRDREEKTDNWLRWSRRHNELMTLDGIWRNGVAGRKWGREVEREREKEGREGRGRKRERERRAIEMYWREDDEREKREEKRRGRREKVVVVVMDIRVWGASINLSLSLGQTLVQLYRILYWKQ